MDGNHTVINAATTGAESLSATVQGADSGKEGATGFARLFSMLQNKANALVHGNEKRASADTSGDSAPATGNVLPLQFDYKNNTPKTKHETAVLSISAERKSPSLAEEAGVVGLTKGAPLAEHAVPRIHLPEVGGDSDAAVKAAVEKQVKASVSAPVRDDPHSKEVVDIPPVGKITFSGTKPNVASTVHSQALDAAGDKGVQASLADKAHIASRGKPSTAKVSGKQAQNTAQTVTAETASPAVVTETGFMAGEGLGGIDALRRELRDGHYAASRSEHPVAVTRRSKSRQSTPVEVAGLEVRPANSKPSADSLVEAAFLRPAAEVSGKAVPERTFAVKKTMSPSVNSSAAATSKQVFDMMWKNAHPVSDIVNDKTAEPVPGAKPVSDLSASSPSSISLVDASLSVSSTRPSLATQPMMSQSQPAGLPTPTLNIRQPGWEQGLASNVSWMAHHNLKDIQVRISPADLGPIHLHATMDKDQLSLQIVAQHGVTREALEIAAPRLRELLGNEQFSSVNVDVSNGGFSHQQGFADNGAPVQPLNDDEGLPPFIEPQAAATPSASAAQIGLIDTFA